MGRLASRTLRAWLIAGLALTLGGCGLLQLFGPRQPRTVVATLSAGSAEGLRTALARSLAEPAARRGVALRILPSAGSREALQWVEDGKLDFALVQGGLPIDAADRLRQAAVLNVEPLHLLLRGVPGEPPPPSYTLADASRMLQSREAPRVNVGPNGSGTKALANELLRFFGLRPGDDYTPCELTYAELLSPTLTAEAAPDAVFTVSSLPSPVARRLIGDFGYRLVALPVASAFRVLPPAGQGGGADRGQGRVVARRGVVAASIPAYAYQVSPPAPREDLPTIGARLQLVVRRDLPSDVVERVVDSVYGPAFASLAEPPLSLDLLRSAAEFDLHAGAEEYLRKKTPVITENLIELTEQVLAIVGALCGALLFAWQGWSLVRRRRRDRQFLNCVQRVGEIEQRAMRYERAPEMQLGDLLTLQQELNAIRESMIEQFQAGAIDGAETLSGFLMHINDANENLTRMILHEREARPPRAGAP